MNGWNERAVEMVERMVREVCPPAPEETRELWREQFLELGAQLQTWSRRFNITRIRDAEGIVVRHFVDSLLALPLIPEGARRLIDVGCGAGFPGLPIKIVRPELEVAFLDSRLKAITFVRHAAAVLGLEGVSFHHLRAEEATGQEAGVRRQGAGEEERERLVGGFDCATAKAVGKVGKVVELCLPFLRVRQSSPQEEGGWVIAFLPSGGLADLESQVSGFKFQVWEREAEGFGWQRKFLVVERGGNGLRA